MSEAELTNNLKAAFSEAKEAVTETKEVQEVQKEESQNEPPEAKEPDGKEFVETQDKAALARIKYLSKQIHASDERNKQYEVIMAEQDKKIDLLLNKFTSQEESEALKIVKSQLKEAQEHGDVEKVGELIERLTDIKTESKLKTIPKTEARPVKAQPQFFSPQELQYVEELSNDREYLKPGHKDYNKAFSIAKSILDDYDSKGKVLDVPELMDTIHERMTKKPASAEVLPSNLRAPQPSAKIRLSDEQMRYAKKLGLSEDRIKTASKFSGKTRVSVDDF
jgi:hypothetical protein